MKTTPAMAAGLTDRVWTVKDIIGLMDPNGSCRRGDGATTVSEP